MLLSNVLTITFFFKILLNMLSDDACVEFMSKKYICITRLFFYKLAGERLGQIS